MTARDFDGSTDRIDWANVLDPTGQAQTFSTWITFDASTTQSWFFVVQQSGDSAFSLQFGLPQTTQRLSLQINGTTNLIRASTSTAISNATYHVAYTWDGGTTASNVHIYVNGSEVSYVTTNNGASLSSGAGSWSLGGYLFSDIRNTDCRMWSTGFWDRIVSSDEIAALAAGYHPTCLPYGLQWCPDLSSLYDPYSGLTGTADGTTTQDSLGPQIMPCGPMVYVSPPSNTIAPLAKNHLHKLMVG